MAIDLGQCDLVRAAVRYSPIGLDGANWRTTSVLSVITLSVGALAIISLMAAFAWTIRENLRRGEAVRVHLAARLQDLPLARVLPLYGCTVMTYLHARPLLAIEQEFRRCKACEATEHCEAALRQRAGTTAFSFCPNQVALEQFAAQCQR